MPWSLDQKDLRVTAFHLVIRASWITHATAMADRAGGLEPALVDSCASERGTSDPTRSRAIGQLARFRVSRSRRGAIRGRESTSAGSRKR